MLVVVCSPIAVFVLGHIRYVQCEHAGHAGRVKKVACAPDTCPMECFAPCPTHTEADDGHAGDEISRRWSRSVAEADVWA